MSKVSHDVRTVQNSFQKFVFSSHVIDVHLFWWAKSIGCSTPCELIFKSMNCPSNMSRKRTIILSVCWLGFPNELSLVLQKNMFIRSFDEKSLNTQMSQNGQSCLWMSKGICWDCCLWSIVELIFQEVKASLEILDDVIVVGTTFIMLNKSSANNLPILSFQKILNFLFSLWILLIVPFLEKSHLTVEKWSVTFLTSFAICLSMFFALTQDSCGSIEDLLNWIESIASKVWHDIALSRFRIIVTVHIKYPKGIQMWMYWHMKRVRLLSSLVASAILILIGSITFVLTGVRCMQNTCNQNNKQDKVWLVFHW
jgi:hypothetical protein